MDKQQEDSLSAVAVSCAKDYAPSEVYSAEPPPAYQRPASTAVQVARIVAVTLVVMSVVLGCFILAAAYVQAASCQNAAPMPVPAAHSAQEDDQPSFQHLVDPLQSEETSAEQEKQSVEPPPQNSVQFKLPLTLDFDELAGSLVERNQKSRMNCVVEKRRAEEIVDHQPKTLRLPFGLNLTTDPRYEHVAGERMAIFCESGKEQSRHMPMEAAPIIVPLPGPVHLPLHFNGPMQHQPQQERKQHIQFSEHHATPIQVTEIRQVPVQMEARRIPIQVAEAQRMPVHMAEAHQIPIQMVEQIPIQVETHQIPIHMAEAHQMPNRMGEIHQMPIRMGETHQRPIAMAEAQMTDYRAVAEGRAFPPQELRPPLPRVQPDSPRPHYVQPRSVRSVDSVLHKRDKRMRRCACDCNC